jgi:hypothetical protein
MPMFSLSINAISLLSVMLRNNYSFNRSNIGSCFVIAVNITKCEKATKSYFLIRLKARLKFEITLVNDMKYVPMLSLSKNAILSYFCYVEE